MLGIGLRLFTVIVGHATFCIVVVYNNVVARLRRASGSLEEASADLGADTWQTFWLRHPADACRPRWSPAALLAFALSFDEIIVTRSRSAPASKTLPIWIFENLFRGQPLPIVNVVAVFGVADLDHPRLPRAPPHPRRGRRRAARRRRRRWRPRRPRFPRAASFQPEGQPRLTITCLISV